MKDLRSETQDSLKEALIDLGEKAFRAKQIYEWIVKGVTSFEEMKNLPLSLREQLGKLYYLDNVKISEQFKSEDGTIKMLNVLKDDEVIESVYMTYKHGQTACISSQVGCKMKCSFCASTLNGMSRNLLAGEMMGQIYEMQNITNTRINHVVIMGSGEPLDNYVETLKFIKMACDESGLNLSARNITLSTCGLVPEIKRLADEQLQITLAISLHHPMQSEREKLMPIAKKYNLDDLMSAVDYYTEKTHRRVTFEYALIEGFNDKDEHAHALAKRIKGKLAHVNLIPINSVKEKEYYAPKSHQIKRFKQILEDKYKISTTIRRELGSDINAACGQLRNQHISDVIS